MELSEVYRQILLEIKNNLSHYKDDDIDFTLQMDNDIFNIGTSLTKDKPQILDELNNNDNFNKTEEISNTKINHIPNFDSNQEDKETKLYKINKQVSSCKKCPLYKTRNNTVFGEGNLDADIMFIGEGPGSNEDLTGRPFVGKAGDLLVKIIENVMKLKREDVYMANIVKCRPPGNRNPNNIEVSSCIGYLHKQISIINPKIIVPLGSVALSTLLPQHRSIIKSRGQNMILALSKEKIYDVIPTYHPSYLLRGERTEINKKKREVWEDIKKIMAKLNLPI